MRVARPRGRSLRRRLLAGFLAGLAAAACSVRVETRAALERPDAGSGLSALVLFFDGLSGEAFHRLLAQGSLPNLKATVVDRGLSFSTALSSVPTETYPNVGAMLTGLFPGHHGIPANIWLDRRLSVREAHTNLFRIYSASDFLTPDARTLYERLPSGSVAVTAPLARGVTLQFKNAVAITAAYARNDWPFLDRKTLDDAGDAYAGAARAGRLPPLVWAHLLGPDEVAHYDGPESDAFRRTLESADRAFGRLVKRLERLRALDRVLFVLVGDHGNASYTRVANAEELVYRALVENPAAVDCGRGGCTMLPTGRAKKEAFALSEAKVAVGAYRGAMVWLPALHPPEAVPSAFRSRKARRREAKAAKRRPTPDVRPPSDFVAALARFPEVRLVAARGSEPDEVEIYGPAGRSEILVDDEGEGGVVRFLYRVVEGEDPLGYAADASVAPRLAEALTAAEWLRLTAHTAFPDLVVQLPEFFESPRAPDLLVSPRDGIGFREGRAAGHGGLSRAELVVPLVFAGPGVARGTRDVARVVDLAPTLLRWMGVAYEPDEMDGEDLGIRSEPIGPFPPLNPDAADD